MASRREQKRRARQSEHDRQSRPRHRSTPRNLISGAALELAHFGVAPKKKKARPKTPPAPPDTLRLSNGSSISIGGISSRLETIMGTMGERERRALLYGNWDPAHTTPRPGNWDAALSCFTPDCRACEDWRQQNRFDGRSITRARFRFEDPIFAAASFDSHAVVFWRSRDEVYRDPDRADEFWRPASLGPIYPERENLHRRQVTDYLVAGKYEISADIARHGHGQLIYAALREGHPGRLTIEQRLADGNELRLHVNDVRLDVAFREDYMGHSVTVLWRAKVTQTVDRHPTFEDAEMLRRDDRLRLTRYPNGRVVYDQEIGERPRRRREHDSRDPFYFDDGRDAARYARRDYMHGAAAEVCFNDPRPPLSREELEAQEREAREAARLRREAEAARQKAAEEARERAMALFESKLLEGEREQWAANQYVDVAGSETGRVYRIKGGSSSGNVKIMDGERVVESLCAAPSGTIPLGDKLLGQYLAIKFDERSFLDKANVTFYGGVNGPFYCGPCYSRTARLSDFHLGGLRNAARELGPGFELRLRAINPNIALSPDREGPAGNREFMYGGFPGGGRTMANEVLLDMNRENAADVAAREMRRQGFHPDMARVSEMRAYLNTPIPPEADWSFQFILDAGHAATLLTRVFGYNVPRDPDVRDNGDGTYTYTLRHLTRAQTGTLEREFRIAQAEAEAARRRPRD